MQYDSFIDEIWRTLDGDCAALEKLKITGVGALPSVYRVTDFATASVAAVGLSIAELLAKESKIYPDISVDRRLASLWFGFSIRPMGWTLPPAWDPIAGDYRTKDGWIRLHTNAPHHRLAAEKILGAHSDKAVMARAVGEWTATALETAIVAAGGCAAEMRTAAQWIEHPQGKALSGEPLIANVAPYQTASSRWVPRSDRPLAGLKVLDLTRVLAGPVAGRALAGYGAQVLRIDPPHWDEPGVIPEVTLGKSCARLDLTSQTDRSIFEELLSQADILLHGYRPDALDALGYDLAARRNISPAIIDVSLSAYGWAGPWSKRRGFDSLVQMSTGIADAGIKWKGTNVPTPLPVQALDHATGYLMAAAAIRAITRRGVEGVSTSSRLSLARTAKLLMDSGEAPPESALAPESAEDFSPAIENTSWGEAHRLRPPISVVGAEMHWQYPARALGSTPPSWLP